jgi:hypothetical protein
MEKLNKAYYARNPSIIVPSKVVDLKHEYEMVARWEFNHTLLQNKLMSCNPIKHMGSVSVIFLMLSFLMFSTWMVVNSVRCERVQMTNNMISIVMVIMKFIMMRQMHKTEFKDKGQVGRAIPHLMTG